MTNVQKTDDRIPRPPVVVVLGHVDHGKTTILDKIRQSRVAEKEAGGITQHIGAYQVDYADQKVSGKITFLDTPGHEAFSAIRSRGARVADVAVLVVAADEGLKPQTLEALEIIKNENMPFVVALNKMDKEGANPARIKQELAEREVFVEGYGGQVPIVELSAKTGQGLDHLLEIILLLAELQELKSSPQSPTKGVVVESRLDKRRGLVATLIVQEGELKIGDWIVAGDAFGKVKSLENFLGKPIKSALPSTPCVVLGWDKMPALGQEFKVVDDKKEAQAIAVSAQDKSIQDLFVSHEDTEAADKKIANLLIKADVQSSLEAIDQSLKAIKSAEVGYKVTSFGIGNITDGDVKNAKATGSSIIGFHATADDSVKQLAEREGVRVEIFDVIYALIERVREILSDLLAPDIKREALGKIKILAVFSSKGSDAKSQIVGGKVIQGKAVRGALIDVFRSGEKILSGRLSQLQQNKNDVAEAPEGLEVGIRFDPIRDGVSNGVKGATPLNIEVGDVLEIYQEEKIKRSV